MTPILHDHLPFTPWADPALSRSPGMTPVLGNWIVRDEVFDQQIAERRRLRAAYPVQTYASLPAYRLAEQEAVRVVLNALPSPTPQGDAPAKAQTLADLAPLLQEDLLVLCRAEREYILTAGLLCFPASWTLSEKVGHPLTRIHSPVRDYPVSPVQRLFDRLPAGRALWRANALGYADPTLYQPRSEADPRSDTAAHYLRCERQTLLRLPQTGAVLFAVHTYLLRPSALTPEQRRTCPIQFS